MNKQSGFEIQAEQRQSWQSIALVWAGGMICVPCLMIGGVLSQGGLSLWEIVISILIGSVADQVIYLLFGVEKLGFLLRYGVRFESAEF